MPNEFVFGRLGPMSAPAGVRPAGGGRARGGRNDTPKRAKVNAVLCIAATWVAATASAQSALPSDVSITSLGIQGLVPTSVGPNQGAALGDVDFLLSQRLRWTLTRGDSPDDIAIRALVDARFQLDPGPGPAGDPGFEWSQVRQLGAQLHTERITVDLGRHPVFRGGPRLVDGLQVLVRPTDDIDIGVWGGLAPSLFTSLPLLRPGGGPIFAITRSRMQLSLVGEVLTFEGALDRAGFLAMGRVSTNRLLEVSGRLDAELASADGGPRIADFQVASLFSPVEAIHIDALYNAFSSFRYVSSADRDPDLQRFALRLQQLGLELGLQQDVRDPTLNHMLGLGARAEPTGDNAAHASVIARYRHNVDPDNRMSRLSPTVGFVRMLGRANVLANGNLIQVAGRPQFDAGLQVAVDVTDSLAVDGSVRLMWFPLETVEGLIAPVNGQGWYADLYIDVVAPGDLILFGGVSIISEPDVNVGDGSYGLFVRAAKYLRPRK